ncbi:MAG: DUF4172 domain-containing protein [Desulfovibrio sp.]|nr:DUF4172 domain-containing protein [Desulfovibrio sp.]
MIINNNAKDNHELSTAIKDRSWIWKNPDWLNFADLNEDFLSQAKELDGSESKLTDLCSHQSFKNEQFRIFAGNILANWNIEGIRLSRKSVRSSLANALGIGVAQWKKHGGRSKEERAVAATLEMLSSTEPIALELILSAHAMLRSDDQDDWGKIRNHPESVYAFDVDGAQYSVYDAPPHEFVPELMRRYLSWWRMSKNELPRSAGAILAHLLFVVIHPFRDGNGRMARMLADRYLSESSGSLFRPYSLSVEIERNKFEYYSALESITEAQGMGRFLDFMLAMHANAINGAMERSLLLRQAHTYLNDNNIILTDSELELLHTCCANPGHRWSFISATKDMEDGEEAENAWNSLIEKGFISENGIFVIP